MHFISPYYITGLVETDGKAVPVVSLLVLTKTRATVMVYALCQNFTSRSIKANSRTFSLKRYNNTLDAVI